MSVKRLLDCTARELAAYGKQQLLAAIAGSEGRVLACETIGITQPLLGDVTNAEYAAALSADIVLLNMFDVQQPVVQALRTRRSAAQKQLGRAGRMQNAKTAYACRPGTDLSGKRVLLVDDIITTGATASACALALLQAGASDVTAAAIAAVEELPRQQRIDTEKHT